MSEKFTNTFKCLFIGLLLPMYMFSNVAAQVLEDPEGEEYDQFLFPHVFNMDDDDIPWGDEVTLWPFEGAALERIENPDKSGINETDFVLEYEKTDGGQPWAGFFYDLEVPMDMDDVEESVFKLKVWSPREGLQATLKLEVGDFDSGDLHIPIPGGKEEWVELEWDLAEIEAAPYERVVLFMDFVDEDGELVTPGGGFDYTWYLDDFRIEKDEVVDIEPIALEDPEGDEYDQFLFPHVFNMDNDDIPWGEEVTLWPFEGAALERIGNPDRSGLNRTNAVLSYEKTDGGQPWAGFFYDLEVPMDMDDVEESVFRLKVWSPREGLQATLKLEVGDFDSGDLHIPIPGGKEEWVQLEWDLSEIEPAPYERVVLFMDFVDEDGEMVTPGGGFDYTWYLDDFRIEKIDDTSSELVSSEVPQTLQLSQNYPNPFNPTTQIDFALPEASQVTLEVYNMLGQQVVTLEDGHLSAGQHSVTFDASELSSGVYLYRLQAGSQVLTRSLTLVK